MSFRPYADEAYDDESLAARFGYVISHELSHSNLNTAYAAGADALLKRYPHASTRNEAFADVLGTLGVLRTGLVDRETLCQHVSQAWCARVPPSYYGDYGQSHPQARAADSNLSLVALAVRAYCSPFQPGQHSWRCRVRHAARSRCVNGVLCLTNVLHSHVHSSLGPGACLRASVSTWLQHWRGACHTR